MSIVLHDVITLGPKEGKQKYKTKYMEYFQFELNFYRVELILMTNHKD